MLLRILTALVLLAAFLAALLLLDQAWFSALAGAIVALGANEWARLTGWRGPMTLAYAVACVAVWYAFLQLPDLTGGLMLGALVFWIGAAPYWLARGWHASPAALSSLVGLAVLVPAGVAMAVLPRADLLMLLGLVWIADSAAYFSGQAFCLHQRGHQRVEWPPGGNRGSDQCATPDAHPLNHPWRGDQRQDPRADERGLANTAHGGDRHHCRRFAPTRRVLPPELLGQPLLTDQLNHVMDSSRAASKHRRVLKLEGLESAIGRALGPGCRGRFPRWLRCVRNPIAQQLAQMLSKELLKLA